MPAMHFACNSIPAKLPVTTQFFLQQFAFLVGAGAEQAVEAGFYAGARRAGVAEGLGDGVHDAGGRPWFAHAEGVGALATRQLRATAAQRALGEGGRGRLLVCPVATLLQQFAGVGGCAGRWLGRWSISVGNDGPGNAARRDDLQFGLQGGRRRSGCAGSRIQHQQAHARFGSGVEFTGRVCGQQPEQAGMHQAHHQPCSDLARASLLVCLHPDPVWLRESLAVLGLNTG